MNAASTSSQRIDRTAALTSCRFCGALVTAEEVLCACRVGRGEIPHTEYSSDLKRYLCTRTLERRMLPGTSMQSFWDRLVTGLYAGSTQAPAAAGSFFPCRRALRTAFPTPRVMLRCGPRAGIRQ